MTSIYSNIDQTKLLHIINRKADIEPGRKDLCPATEFLQCAAMRLPKGKTFQPHKHFYRDCPAVSIVQESWVVITGMVKVFLYDTDDTVIHTDILEAGDCSITFHGGHTYEIMADDTRVLEYKTGPYIGQQHDKVFI